MREINKEEGERERKRRKGGSKGRRKEGRKTKAENTSVSKMPIYPVTFF